MAKDRSILAVALRRSSTWVASRACVMGSLAVVVLFSGLFWGLYPPPTPAVHHYNASRATVQTWAEYKAKCASGGHASHMNQTDPDTFSYDCQGTKMSHAAFFTILVILGALVLMVAGYPTDLTMLGATVIFVAAGVLDPYQGAAHAILSLLPVFNALVCPWSRLRVLCCVFLRSLLRVHRASVCWVL
jgi:hypothetical protein